MTQPEEPYPVQRLYRSSTDRILAGVAGGIAEYLRLDSAVVRILFIALSFAGGTGLVLYVVCWLLMPEKDDMHRPVSRRGLEQNAEKIVREVEDAWSRSGGPRNVGGWLVLLGVIFLLANFNLVSFDDISRLWPLLLIFAGWRLLSNRR